MKNFTYNLIWLTVGFWQCTIMSNRSVVKSRHKTAETWYRFPYRRFRRKILLQLPNAKNQRRFYFGIDAFPIDTISSFTISGYQAWKFNTLPLLLRIYSVYQFYSYRYRCTFISRFIEIVAPEDGKRARTAAPSAVIYVRNRTVAGKKAR